MFSVRRPAARSRLRDNRIPQRLHYQSFSMLILLLLSHTRYGRPLQVRCDFDDRDDPDLTCLRRF